MPETLKAIILFVLSGKERTLPFTSTRELNGSRPCTSCTSPSGKTMKYSLINMDESYKNREFVATSKFTIFMYSTFEKKIKKREKILSIVVEKL